jgi:putative component of membrane protein insertase Oxa1/YidC/SpoIIIJ protein YidD
MRFYCFFSKSKIIQKLNSQMSRPTNETAIIGIQLIRFYQKHISSQDRLGVCIYSTSCSHFALLAVKRKGFVLGTLLTADRLQRCNSAASQYYFLDPSTGKCVDPIIRLWLEK